MACYGDSFTLLTSCDFCKNRPFGVFPRSELRLLVPANVLSPPILVNLMMESLRSSESSVATKTARRHIPEDGVLSRMFILFHVSK
jgi:hypothetical protein